MTSSKLRSLVLSLALLAGSTAIAQQAHDHSAGTEAPVACGSLTVSDVDYRLALANTARANPALYQRMLLDAKRADRPAGLMKGTTALEQQFYVYDRQKAQFVQVAAALVHDGARARVWIDVLDTARLPLGSSKIAALVTALETTSGPSSRDQTKGIIENAVEVFGETPKQFEIDGKTDFLLTDIKDNMQGANVLGYFSPNDQSGNPGSNRTNILYIDSKEGLSNYSTATLLGILSHEFQHLIHYGRNSRSEIFYNEGCSESASIVTGYPHRTNSKYLVNTNVDLLSWPTSSTDGNTVVAAYERALTLVHYLYEQFGERFLYEFAGSSSTGLARIDEALGRLDVPAQQMSAAMALRGFAVANYLQKKGTEPEYGFTFSVARTVPSMAATYSAATLPATGKVRMNRYGISYLRLTDPGTLQLRFSGSSKFTVMAIIEGLSGTEVRELAPATTHALNPAAGDRVTLALVNLENVQHDVSWSTSEEPLGVESGADLAARLSFASISPNPIVSAATVRFRLPQAGPVTLELFDGRGAVVRTLAAGETFAAGEHELRLEAADLPSGYYMVRLTQGERTVTNLVTIAR